MYMHASTHTIKERKKNILILCELPWICRCIHAYVHHLISWIKQTIYLHASTWMNSPFEKRKNILMLCEMSSIYIYARAHTHIYIIWSQESRKQQAACFSMNEFMSYTYIRTRAHTIEQRKKILCEMSCIWICTCMHTI